MTQGTVHLLIAAILLSAGYYKSNPKFLVGAGWITVAAAFVFNLQDIWRLP